MLVFWLRDKACQTMQGTSLEGPGVFVDVAKKACAWNLGQTESTLPAREGFRTLVPYVGVCSHQGPSIDPTQTVEPVFQGHPQHGPPPPGYKALSQGPSQSSPYFENLPACKRLHGFLPSTLTICSPTNPLRRATTAQ